MDGALANFSDIVNFANAHATVPLKALNLLKLKF
jgi:hypothetical protein